MYVNNFGVNIILMSRVTYKNFDRLYHIYQYIYYVGLRVELRQFRYSYFKLSA